MYQINMMHTLNLHNLYVNYSSIKLRGGKMLSIALSKSALVLYLHIPDQEKMSSS